MMIIFDNHKEFYEEREKCADQDIVYGVLVCENSGSTVYEIK